MNEKEMQMIVVLRLGRARKNEFRHRVLECVLMAFANDWVHLGSVSDCDAQRTGYSTHISESRHHQHHSHAASDIGICSFYDAQAFEFENTKEIARN